MTDESTSSANNKSANNDSNSDNKDINGNGDEKSNEGQESKVDPNGNPVVNDGDAPSGPEATQAESTIINMEEGSSLEPPTANGLVVNGEPNEELSTEALVNSI